jgi:hypothetical protein
VESLDPMTESGKAAFVALMQMSESADTYYKYLEDARKNIKESDYPTRTAYLRALHGYASGGDFPGGWGIFGENGPEVAYSPPAKVFSNAQSKSLLNTDELVGEVRKLREEVGRGNFYSKANSDKITKFLSRWEGDGLPATRT